MTIQLGEKNNGRALVLQGIMPGYDFLFKRIASLPLGGGLVHEHLHLTRNPKLAHYSIRLDRMAAGYFINDFIRQKDGDNGFFIRWFEFPGSNEYLLYCATRSHFFGLDDDMHWHTDMYVAQRSQDSLSVAVAHAKEALERV